MGFSFDLLINALIAGILLGGFYAAVTLGVSISFGILDIVNIAHPAFIILGSYIAYIVNTRLGIDPILVSIVMLPAFYLLGAGVYQVYYESFEKRGQDALRGLAFFFGLLFVTEVMLILVFGVDYRYVEAPYIGPSLATRRDGSAAAHAGAVRGVARHVRRRCSSSCRTPSSDAPSSAVAQDQLALRLMGASPIRIKRIAFAISIATASVAGALLIIIQPVEPSIGREYIGRVFAICVLGGLGSLPGTVIARDAARHHRELHRDLLRAVLGAGGGVRRPAADARVPAGRSARTIGLSIVRTRVFLSGLDRGRGSSCSSPRAWWATITCSSPAIPCCNSSCWRPPGTSSAAIPAT